MKTTKLKQWTPVFVLGLSTVLAVSFGWGAKSVSAQGCDYGASVLADNPIAYWRLGEDSASGTTSDNIGSAVDPNGSYMYGVTQGVGGLVSGDADLAAHFDGVDDFVSIPNHPLINYPNPSGFTQKTAELWFSANALGGKQVLYEQGGIHNGLNIFLDDNRLTLGVWTNDAGHWISTTVSANTIYHVALVFDGNDQMLTGYLNGASFGFTSTVNSILEQPGLIAIGAVDDETRFSNTEAIEWHDVTLGRGAYFNGIVDEVALYNQVLSSERIELHALGCRPAISVIKSGPVTSNVGETVSYTYTLTNAGSSSLQVVQVEDDYAGTALTNFVGGDDNSNDWLDLTEAWVYTASYTIQPTDPNPLINTVSVTATNSVNATVSATATHSSILAGFTPVVDLIKDGPDTANVGDTIVYTFTVSHHESSDGSPISSLSVSDTIAGPAGYASGDDNDSRLELGETWVYTASYTPQINDNNPLVNTGTVTGKDPEGDSVTDSDIHSTALSGYAPMLRVDPQWPTTARISETIVYTFTISHDPASDGSSITNITVGDTLTGMIGRTGGDDGDNWLEDGEGWVYVSSYLVKSADPSPLTNTLSVTGQDRDGDPVNLYVDYVVTTRLLRVYLPFIVR